MHKTNKRLLSLLLAVFMIVSMLPVSALADESPTNDDNAIIDTETGGGETDSGETDSGEADGGETDSGETDSGETDSGEADSGETEVTAEPTPTAEAATPEDILQIAEEVVTATDDKPVLMADGDDSGDETTPDFDFTNATADESGDCWTWTQETKTLTLSGAAITTAVTLPADSAIVANSGTSNSIIVSDAAPVTTSGTLSISGTGQLEIKAVASDDSAPAHTIVGAETITVEGTTLTTYGFAGLSARHVKISDATVDITGYGYAIYYKGATGSTSVVLNNVHGSLVSELDCGIELYMESNADNSADEMANAFVSITNCNDLTIQGEQTRTDKDNSSGHRSAIWIYTRDAETNAYVDINNSSLTIDGSGGGIYVNSHSDNSATDDASAAWVKIADSNVNVLSDTYTWAAIFVNNNGTGEHATADVTIENSTVVSKAVHVGIMTSTKDAASTVDIARSSVTVSGSAAGIRVKANTSDAAKATVTESTITVEGETNMVIDEMDNGDSSDATDSSLDANSTLQVEGAVAMIGTKSYDTLAEAIAAAEADAVITIIADHEISTAVVIEKNVTIDLNGKTITAAENVYPVIRVQGDANVIIKDSSENETGSIVNATDYVFVLGASDGTSAGNLTIESGSYTGNVTVASVTKGTLTINGGEFAVTASEYGATYLLNCVDANYADNSAKIIVYGGTFTGFNPADNEAESGDHTSFAAPGYVATESNGVYTVAEWNGIIDNVDELLYFAELVNSGTTFEGKTVTLNADIDLSSVANWTPIGNGTNYFWGTFDGQNHTISNMTINVNTPDAKQFVGLFGGVRKATIKNLNMTNVKIDVVGAQVRAAAVVALAHSNSENHTTANINLENITVDGCTINAEAKSSSLAVGGLSGYCYPANMTNISVSNLTVNPKASGSVFAGGLVGYMQGQNISNNGNTRAYYTVDTFNLNNITIKTETYDSLVGGFAGYTYYGYITLKNATINGFKAEITGTSRNENEGALVGGLIGLAHRSDKGHTFTNVNITGLDIDVSNYSGRDVLAGGLVGYSGSPIAYADCSVSGTITETCTNDDVNSLAIVGGFVGGAYSYIQSFTNCTADVDITATNCAGGFVGSNSTTATYTDCEAKGTVAAATAGGFAGATKNATYINCTYTGESDIPFIPGYVALIGSTYYKTLAEAITAANAVAEGGATVTLLQNVTLGEKLTISGDVTIEGAYIITRADDYTGTLFTVNSGATLTLDGGLVIDGGNEYVFDSTAYMADAQNRVNVSKDNSAKWFTPEEGAPVATAFMITTTGGTVNLNKVTIQNNYSVSSGIVSAGAGSTITLTGAKITHVASTQGNGVVANVSGVDINVTVNEGTVIDGNHVGGNHGIFKIYSGAMLTMNGGEITNNTGWNSNGVVVGIYWGSFYLNGGTICSNTSVVGPNNSRCAAIYGHSGHTFVMTGGTICHNSGAYGGLDAPYSNGKTEITGGYIVNNVSYTGNSYADINGSSAMTISGGTFTQDVSQWLAPGSGLAYNEETRTYGTTEYLYEYNGTAYMTMAKVIDAIAGTPATTDGESAIPVVKVLVSHKVEETMVINADMILDLNGKTIYGYGTINPIFRVLADVTVTGEGMIDTENYGDGYCFIVGNTETSGTLTIENGTFKGNTTAISVTKGKLTILDGDFRIAPYVEEDGTNNYSYLLNCIDANYKAGTAVIEVKGGTFRYFDPANNAAEGEGTSFVAEGYTSESNDEGTTYTVRALNYVAQIGETKYESLAEAFTAAENGDTITILKDHEISTAVVIEKNVTIDLNGKTITAAENVYPVIRVQGGADVIIKDSSENEIGSIVNATDYVFVLGASDSSSAGNLTIESGTYTGQTTVASVTKGLLTITGGTFATSDGEYGATYLLNCIDANYADGSAKIVVTGGTFVGFNPADNASEGEGTNFCATGYEAVDNNNGTYVVKAWDYEIWDVDDLMMFQEMANAGNNFSGITVKLMADIDLGGATWTPINSFAGEFDGNGDRENNDGSYTISNFHIDATISSGGFFKTIEAGDGERVHDLTLSDVTASVGAYRFGTLANVVKGIVNRVTVKNVTVTTTHTSAWVGGMCAFMSWPWMNNCSVESLTVNAQAGADLIGGFSCILQKNSNMVFDNNDVKGFKVTVVDTDSSGCGVGGFVAQTQRGWEYPKITNSDITGIDITASGLVDVGGFIAWPGAHTTAENCTTEGKIDVTNVTSADCFAGGFFGNLGWNADLGQMGHVVTDCSANVNIITKIAPAGGFVGSATNSNNASMYATFTNCSATGNITCVEGGTAPIGGFAGDADRGNYTNCSATGTITNNGIGYAGSFIGEVLDTTPTYDSRYPAGTREYPADELTFDSCTAAGEPFIGYVAETKPANELVNVSSYVAEVNATYYTTFGATLTAAEDGDTITLLAPVVLNEGITLDLTGLTVNGNGVYPAFRIQNGASVTVKGGTVTNSDYVFVLGASDGSSAGNLTIESGSYTGQTTVASVTKGTLTINGGEFATSEGEYGATYLLNCIDANYVDGSAKIVVTGGSFYNFNPENNAAEGTGTNFVAEGYIAEETETDSNIWVVSEDLYVAQNTTTGTKYKSLTDALTAAASGQTVKLLKDVEHATVITIEKAITLDLGRKTLTTTNGYGGLYLKSGCSLKNGTLNHTGNTAAIKAWNVDAIEDVTINVSYTENKTKGGIVIQNNATNRINTIKNVTIQGNGLTNGIETYNCGDATEPVIGFMENVTINAVGVAMNISAPCGTATNCSFTGGVYGIEIWIKGTYSATLDLKGCTVTGGEQAVYAHDEFSSNPNIENKGTLKLTIDEDTTLVNNNGALLNLVIARAENVDMTAVIDRTVAKIGDVYYDTLQKAVAAAETGNTITILKDHKISTAVVIEKNVTIDLNGKTITAAENVYPVIRVQGDADVIIKDSSENETGRIVNATDYVFVLGASDGATTGNLTIESGSYTGQITVASVTKGLLTITGGTFATSGGEYGATYLLNCIDANYADGSAKIVVTGGSFTGFNPESNAAEGTGTNFVAEGYIAEETETDSNIWEVFKNPYVAQLVHADGTEGAKYESLTNALTAAKSGQTVKLLASLKESNVMIAPGVTLNLNGKNLTADYVVGFKGSNVIDSTYAKAGGLYLTDNNSDNLILDKGNIQVPIWNEDHYEFWVMKHQSKMNLAADETSFTYESRPSFNENPGEGINKTYNYRYFHNGMADNKLSVVIRLTWTNSVGRTVSQDFLFSDNDVEKVYHDKDTTNVFYVTCTGVSEDNFKDLSATTVIISDTGAEFVGTTLPIFNQ